AYDARRVHAPNPARAFAAGGRVAGRDRQRGEGRMSYELKSPAGMPPELAAAFTAALEGAGVQAKAGQSVIDHMGAWFDGRVKVMSSANKQSIEDEIQRVWGADAPRNREFAKAGIKAI